MQTHPDTLGALATDRGRVRQAEATRERHLATALVALAAVLIFVSTAVAAPQEHTTAKVDAANYFVQHPGPASGQSEFDPFDPYAPMDTGTVLRSVSFTTVGDVAKAWTPPPPLGRPGQPS